MPRDCEYSAHPNLESRPYVRYGLLINGALYYNRGMSWTLFVTCVSTCVNRREVCESAGKMREAREEAAGELRECGSLRESCNLGLRSWFKLQEI
jgi:hypothetical protein